MNKTFDVYWSPEGRCIATVEAMDERKAIRKAPKPYRKYLGEMYAKEVISLTSNCTVDIGCPRHGNY